MCSVRVCILQLCGAWDEPLFSVLSSQFSVLSSGATRERAPETLHRKRSWLQLVVRSVGRCGQRYVRRWSGDRIAVLVDLHAKTQTHRGENLLDLVQRLAAEVLNLEHFGFGLLHELANGLDVRVFQAVVAAHGQFELFDRAVEILVVKIGRAS